MAGQKCFFSSAYHLWARAMLMQAPIIRRLIVCPSISPFIRPSVNIDWTNLDDKFYGIHIQSVIILGTGSYPL